ncbi:MAG: sodium:calcium antiporter, partial [Candidatus Aenigmarchaeota archaeon]|nr:sodium:calcium antiporter [Candidatus Aenigmarchaeota archaeon]
ESSEFFNVGRSIIGATIVALGTSLPELSVSLTAIYKRKISIALGDLIGSTVINMTLVLGITSLLGTVMLNETIIFLVSFLLISNMILLYISSNFKIGRSEGLALIGLFIIFLILLFSYQTLFI